MEGIKNVERKTAIRKQTFTVAIGMNGKNSVTICSNKRTKKNTLSSCINKHSQYFVKL